MNFYKYKLHAYCSMTEVCNVADLQWEEHMHPGCWSVDYGAPGTFFSCDDWNHFLKVYTVLRTHNRVDESCYNDALFECIRNG